MVEFSPDDGAEDDASSLHTLAGGDNRFPFLRADETRLVTSVGPEEGWAGHPDPPPEASIPSHSEEATSDGGTHPQQTQKRSAPLPVELTVSTSAGESVTTVMDQPRFLIGRNHCDLEIDDPYVDDVHLQLFVEDGLLMVADVDSTNGIYLGIADQLTMADGDEFLVGQQRLRFRATWNSQKTSPPVELGPAPAGPPARLERILRGGDIASITPIEEKLTIGRETGDLRCPEDVTLADPHARIERSGDTYTISNLTPGVGTFIRVHDQVELVDGDCFVAGESRIEMSFDVDR